MLTADALIRDIVSAHPGSMEVFEQSGIDFCCHGHQSLAEACRQADIPPGEVLARLAALERSLPAEEMMHWERASLRQLIGYIVHHHHEYTRRAVQATRALLAQLNHEGATPELAAIAQAFDRLAREMLFHIAKEEHGLFTRIERLEVVSRGETPPAPPMRAGEASTIRHMMEDHDAAGALITEIKRLAGGYVAPPGASANLHLLYRELQEFERDLHRHVYLENNILFPRALRLEEALRVAAAAGATSERAAG